jgi:hypothetical protein
MTIKALSRILLALTVLVCAPGESQVSTTLTQVVNRIAPVMSLISPAASSPWVAGSALQFTTQISGVAVSAPTGSIQYALTSLLSTSPALTGTVPIDPGQAIWTATPPSGGFTVSASYPGDVNYLPLTVSLNVGPAETFAFTLPTVTLAQGNTWNGTMQVTSLNGFTGTISWACQNVPAPLRCPITQSTSTFTSANGSVSQALLLTISTSPGDFIPATSLLLLGFSFSFRPWRRLQLFAGLAFSCIFLFGVTGCASGGNSQWDPLTPKGTYEVTITGVAGGITQSQQLTVVVQ